METMKRGEKQISYSSGLVFQFILRIFRGLLPLMDFNFNSTCIHLLVVNASYTFFPKCTVNAQASIISTNLLQHNMSIFGLIEK